MNSYLEGLLYANFQNYWDYIDLDTLLTLQKPLTDFPDEVVFITYHQITELYFKLTLHEIEQIAGNGHVILDNGKIGGWNERLDPLFFTERLKRMNRYFDNLIESFDVLVSGMEKDQFLKFRMALLPGSGFQSLQFRKIEIASTDLHLLTHNGANETGTKKGINTDFESRFENMYWKKGAVELSSGNRTLTSTQFEKKYSVDLLAFAKTYSEKNLRAKYRSLPESAKKNSSLIRELRQWDVKVNINWPLAHYKSAVKHLHRDAEYIKATGGTNWQKYLPPRFQMKVFYPELWSEKEKNDWGKEWVEETMSEIKPGKS
ncbi:MAG: tryptophan 2,3-dioxygenase [Bacteroidetes bacterium]|nr:tryptophan 2,3-dioxygenase [Bacteroidota bacterium]